MTLRDLMGDGAPEVEITGLAYSSAERRPGGALLLRARLHGRRPRLRPRRRRARRRRAGVSSARSASACPRSWSTTSAPRWARRPRASTATPPPSCGWSASPAPTARPRRPSWCARCSRPPASRPACSARSSRWSAAREEDGGAHHPRGDRPPGDVRADARRRATRACAMEVSSHALRAGPRDGHPLRGEGVHQPDPGPPRLPRRHGGLLPGQAAAVRRAGAGGGQRRRRVRRAAGGRARRRGHASVDRQSTATDYRAARRRASTSPARRSP